ncbi:hypothetical protein [Parasitella parasitica]|uniref:RlpA-like protein double-psi beta-barrel domain-containing protein n=1 Tax=Parasitella parasitica TaxID=35722 RepID=A0A0B7ND60_9FUNG|nr:hypothetical protein [Parasitella parasitica]
MVSIRLYAILLLLAANCFLFASSAPLDRRILKASKLLKGVKGKLFSGSGTYYQVGSGSCGQHDTNSELVVAMNKAQMENGSNPNNNPRCDKMVTITGDKGTVTAKVVDTCPSCANAFKKVCGDLAEGVCNISWKFLLFDPTSPPPMSVYAKQKTSSSLIYRIFSTRNKNKTIIQLKEHQWDHPPSDVTELELYPSSTEMPIRANLMSFFSPSQQQQQQQHGWSIKPSTIDEFSRIYIATIQKIRLFSHYSMEQQVSIHYMLSYIQHQQQRPLLCRGVYQRDFNSILSGRSMMADSILMNNNRKPRRTRYIFMLLSTPAALVTNNIHPVTNALSKLRRPYAQTYSVIQANEGTDEQEEEKPFVSATANKKVCSFVPADYLLDPASLFCANNATEGTATHHRLGTKLDGGDTKLTTAPSSLSSEYYDLKNIMAKIQIQTN